MVDSESAAVKKSSNEKQQSIIRHSYHFNFVLCSHANHIIIVTCIQFCLHNGKVTNIIIYKCNNVNWFLFQVRWAWSTCTCDQRYRSRVYISDVTDLLIRI